MIRIDLISPYDLMDERWRSRSLRKKFMIQIKGRPATCVHRIVRTHCSALIAAIARSPAREA